MVAMTFAASSISTATVRMSVSASPKSYPKVCHSQRGMIPVIVSRVFSCTGACPDECLPTIFVHEGCQRGIGCEMRMPSSVNAFLINGLN
jgi:hypothetical protein